MNILFDFLINEKTKEAVIKQIKKNFLSSSNHNFVKVDGIKYFFDKDENEIRVYAKSSYEVIGRYNPEELTKKLDLIKNRRN